MHNGRSLQQEAKIHVSFVTVYFVLRAEERWRSNEIDIKNRQCHMQDKHFQRVSYAVVVHFLMKKWVWYWASVILCLAVELLGAWSRTGIRNPSVGWSWRSRWR